MHVDVAVVLKLTQQHVGCFRSASVSEMALSVPMPVAKSRKPGKDRWRRNRRAHTDEQHEIASGARR
jgi:hypothetical protein